MIQNPRAFIFDLDGVITDTAEYHYLAWKELAKDLDITIDRQFNEQLKGISRMESLERILMLNPSLKALTEEEKYMLASTKNNHYLKLIESIDENSILPGIEPLLKEIKENSIKIAVGSASENAFKLVEKLGLLPYFDFIVDASKVAKGKPDPETFTTAADHLGIPYTACIGLEDAAAGVEALNRAAMFSVGIGALEHLAHADYVVRDTAELNFEEIIKRFKHQGVY